MNRASFRKQYIWSLVLSTASTLMLLGIFIMAIFSMFISFTSNSHGDITDTFPKLVGFWILLAVVSVIGMIAGAIWNMVVGFLRSNTQKNGLKLFWLVLGTWFLPFILPILGLFIAVWFQIWAWKVGNEEVLHNLPQPII